jgi:hypothetical protein
LTPDEIRQLVQDMTGWTSVGVVERIDTAESGISGVAQYAYRAWSYLTQFICMQADDGLWSIKVDGPLGSGVECYQEEAGDDDEVFNAIADACLPFGALQLRRTLLLKDPEGGQRRRYASSEGRVDVILTPLKEGDREYRPDDRARQLRNEWHFVASGRRFLLILADDPIDGIAVHQVDEYIERRSPE